MQTDQQRNLRNWQAATLIAKRSLQTLTQHSALQTMERTRQFYMSKKPTLLLTDGQTNAIWCAFQQAKRDNKLEQRSISGVLVHAYHDDTIIVVDYSREVAEIYAHNRHTGTLFVGTILEGEVSISL